MDAELESRLKRLERDNRRWKWCAMAALCLTVGLRLSPEARALTDVEAGTVDANRVIIRDRGNRPRLILGVEKQGAGLTFLGPNGRTHAFLTVSSGELGRTVIEESGAHTPGVYLYDRKGTLTWHAP